VASRRNSPPSCQQSRGGPAKAAPPTEFRPLVKLVTDLQRLERLDQQDGQGHFSLQGFLLLQAQIARLRTTIPSDVLNSYETVKRSDPKAFFDTQLFPLMVLLAVISAWAEQKQQPSAYQDRIADTTVRVRPVRWPSLRCYAQHSFIQKKRTV